MVLADDCHLSHVKRMRQLRPLRILPLDDLSEMWMKGRRKFREGNCKFVRIWSWSSTSQSQLLSKTYRLAMSGSLFVCPVKVSVTCCSAFRRSTRSLLVLLSSTSNACFILHERPSLQLPDQHIAQGLTAMVVFIVCACAPIASSTADQAKQSVTRQPCLDRLYLLGLSMEAYACSES